MGINCYIAISRSIHHIEGERREKKKKKKVMKGEGHPNKLPTLINKNKIPRYSHIFSLIESSLTLH